MKMKIEKYQTMLKDGSLKFKKKKKGQISVGSNQKAKDRKQLQRIKNLDKRNF